MSCDDYNIKGWKTLNRLPPSNSTVHAERQTCHCYLCCQYELKPSVLQCILSPLAPFTHIANAEIEIETANLHTVKLREGKWYPKEGPCSFRQDWWILRFMAGCNMWLLPFSPHSPVGWTLSKSQPSPHCFPLTKITDALHPSLLPHHEGGSKSWGSHVLLF